MKKIIFLSVLTLTIFLVACSNKKQNDVQLKAQNYFVANNVALFGKINVGDIQKLAEIDNIPLFGAMIVSQIDEVKKGLDISTPIYFGAIYEESNPTITAFAKINSKDSLNAYLSEQGYSFTEEKEMLIAEVDNLVFGFNNDYLAIMVGDNVDQEMFVKQILGEGSKAETNKYLTEAIEKVLNDKAPISAGVSLNQLNNIDPSKLITGTNLKPSNATNTDEYKDLYQTFNLQFEKGRIAVHTEAFGDTKQLGKLNFIGNSSAIKNLKISGDDALYLVLNMDFAKLEKNRKELFKEAISHIDLSDLGDFANEFNENQPLTSFANGEAYVVVQSSKSNASELSIQYYVRSKNAVLKQKIKEAIEELDKNISVKITDEAIEGSLLASKDIQLKKKLDVSNDMFRLHADINFLTKLVEASGEDAEYVKAFKSLDINVNKTSADLEIQLNDNSKNALAYLVQYYAGLFLR